MAHLTSLGSTLRAPVRSNSSVSTAQAKILCPAPLTSGSAPRTQPCSQCIPRWDLYPVSRPHQLPVQRFSLQCFPFPEPHLSVLTCSCSPALPRSTPRPCSWLLPLCPTPPAPRPPTPRLSPGYSNPTPGSDWALPLASVPLPALSAQFPCRSPVGLNGDPSPTLLTPSRAAGKRSCDFSWRTSGYASRRRTIGNGRRSCSATWRRPTARATAWRRSTGEDPPCEGGPPAYAWRGREGGRRH